MKYVYNQMDKGVGDCNIAGPEYQIRLESTWEAQKVANLFYKEFDLTRRPKVRISNYHTKCLNGTANSNTGQLHLRNVGANIGVLIHELAHFDKTAAKICNQTSGLTMTRMGGLRRKKRISHGSAFKMAQTEMLLYWRNHIEKTFEIEGSKKSITRSTEDILKKKFRKLNKRVVMNTPTPVFHYGEKVWFISSKTGTKITGTVKRVNRQTISVTPEGGTFGQYWRVSPSVLNKVNEMPKTLIDDRTIEPKPIEEPIEDTAEENHDMICGLMDGMVKYAINDSLSISGIVKCMWVNGVKNTDENRKIAIDYIKNELNLKIR